MQRAAEWKATLRAEPKVARLVVRRLVEPRGCTTKASVQNGLGVTLL
jgi:hypothetical protein